jgi:polypeptide N-acetylgalactosaminyltransferase
MNNLPKASIIMCFHNEAWSVLLRGLHSIISNTPGYLLEEVILVDDFSDFDYLFEPLTAYLYDHFAYKIRVIRNSRREGLIRSRFLFNYLEI